MADTLLTADPPAETPAAVAAETTSAVEATTTTETKTEAAAPAGATPAIPVVYDVKLPEGSTLDASTPERIVAYAQAHGLSQDAAAKAMELLNAEVTAHTEAAKRAYDAQVGQWTKDALADTTIGKTPEERSANIDKGRAVIRRYAQVNPADADALKGFLSETGQGSHPAAVRFFVWLGKAAGEGTLVQPSASGGGGKSPAQILYPDMNP